MCAAVIGCVFDAAMHSVAAYAGSVVRDCVFAGLVDQCYCGVQALQPAKMLGLLYSVNIHGARTQNIQNNCLYLTASHDHVLLHLYA